MTEPTILDQTLAGLAAGLHVREIATRDPVWCDVNDLVAEVWSRPGVEGFDAMPVKDGERVVGLLEKSSGTLQGTAREKMRLLDDSILISADLPLADFIHKVGERSSRLVVTNDGIDAIVTPSDLSKLPVRVFIFTLITHLELLMSELIAARCPNNSDWLTYLSPNRQEKTQGKYEDLKKDGVEVSPLNCTDFCDKRHIVRKLVGWADTFEDQLGDIEKLRNSVAHASNYLGDVGGLATMLTRIKMTEHWIDEISRQFDQSA